MKLIKTETLFENSDGTKEKSFGGDIHVATEIAVYVSSGSVTVGGTFAEGDEEFELSLCNMKTMEITSEACDGLFIILGCEALGSVKFTATEGTTAKAKYLY